MWKSILKWTHQANITLILEYLNRNIIPENSSFWSSFSWFYHFKLTDIVTDLHCMSKGFFLFTRKEKSQNSGLMSFCINKYPWNRGIRSGLRPAYGGKSEVAKMGAQWTLKAIITPGFRGLFIPSLYRIYYIGLMTVHDFFMSSVKMDHSPKIIPSKVLTFPNGSQAFKLPLYPEVFPVLLLSVINLSGCVLKETREL